MRLLQKKSEENIQIFLNIISEIIFSFIFRKKIDLFWIIFWILFC